MNNNKSYITKLAHKLKQFFVRLLNYQSSNSTQEIEMSENLLECRDDGFLLVECRYKEEPLESAVDFEREYEVYYIFDCVGTRVDVGVKTELDEAKFVFGSTEQKVTLRGKGPLSLHTFDQRSLDRAALRRGCSLKITKIAADLSASSRDVVEANLRITKAFNGLLSKAKSLEGLVVALKPIVNSVDIPTLKGVVRNLRDQTIALKESYSGQDAKDALDDVISQINSSICNNPALRDGNDDICSGIPSGSPASTEDELRNQIKSTLDKLTSTSQDITNEAAREVATLYTMTLRMLAIASEETRKKYMPQFCLEQKNAGGTVGAECKDFLPDSST